MQRWESLTSAVRVLAFLGCLGSAACGDEPRVLDGQEPAGPRSADLGQVQFRLDVGAEEIVGGVRFQITSPEHPAMMGVLSPEPGGKILTVTVDLPAGEGYALLVAAYRANGQETCMIRATFDVAVGTLSRVDLTLECDALVGGGADGGIGDGGVAGASSMDASADARAPSEGGRADARIDARATLVDAARDSSAVDAQADADVHDGGEAGRESHVDGALDGPDAVAVDAHTDSAAEGGPGLDATEAGPPDAAAPEDAGWSLPDASSVGIDRDACDVCSQRECGRLRGLDRARDCTSAAGSLAAGPGAGTPRASACAALLDCAHDTACSLDSALGCYCGQAISAQLCQVGAVAGACRAEVEVAAQSTDRLRIVEAFSSDGTLLFAAARVLSCEADRCRLACFGTP